MFSFANYFWTFSPVGKSTGKKKKMAWANCLKTAIKICKLHILDTSLQDDRKIHLNLGIKMSEFWISPFTVHCRRKVPSVERSPAFCGYPVRQGLLGQCSCLFSWWSSLLHHSHHWSLGQALKKHISSPPGSTSHFFPCRLVKWHCSFYQ